jgi:ribonuclease Z
MDITFSGVGEAFDEERPNTSVLISTGASEAGLQILLDCGFTAAHTFWRLAPDPMNLDAIWISHFHGDHFFGLPLLLLRFWEQGRRKPLTLVGREGIEERAAQAMDLAYPGFRSKIQYPVKFRVASRGNKFEYLDCHWSFAENGHSSPCLALRLDHGDGSLFYSGDGAPTVETRALATGCDLVIHEAYFRGKGSEGHGSVDLSLDFARETGTKALALVHMNRDVRRLQGEQVKRVLGGIDEFKALLPEPGDRFGMELLRSNPGQIG